MKLQGAQVSEVSTDLEQLVRCLPIKNGERLLELGCGRADTTRMLAEFYPALEIISTEVDHVQHEENLRIADLPNVTFRYGGAQNIELPDESANYVIMLKSLHHVPVEMLKQSLDEIRRVLLPGGLVYISEPIYAGAFNDILRLFHDEQEVRRAAFTAVNNAVAAADFTLVEQAFYDAIVRFEGFEDFEEKVLGTTHTSFEIDDALHARIKAAFDPHIGPDGVANFRTAQRVDLLARPLR